MDELLHTGHEEAQESGLSLAPLRARLTGGADALRARLASRAGVPAYVVFTDRALREMAGRLPQSEDELLAVSGVGRAKLERYGEEFLPVLRAYAEEHGVSS